VNAVFATSIAGLWQGGAEAHKGLGALLEFAPGAAIWTWLAFLIGLPLTDRDQKVEDSIQAAQKAQQAAEQQMAAAKQELDKARLEARRMVEEATARAERQAADAAKAADERAKVELQKARDAITAEKRAALQEIRQHVVDLTIAATGKLLQQGVDDAANRRLVADFVGQAGSKESR
jgi:F-type H+-transporting ATPase subunit b